MKNVESKIKRCTAQVSCLMNIHQLTSQKVGGAKIQAISLSPAICRVKSLDPLIGGTEGILDL